MRRWTKCGLFACLLAAFGCGKAQDISVGETPPTLQLARCYGEDTRCVDPPAREPLTSQPLEATPCVPAQGVLRTERLWQREAGLSCGAEGECYVHQWEVASDGSVWGASSVASVDQNSLSVTAFLVHYLPDGRIETERVIDCAHRPVLEPTPFVSRVNLKYSEGVTLTTDEQAHAVVGFGASSAAQDPPRIVVYDHTATRVGEPIEILGLDDEYYLSFARGMAPELTLLGVPYPSKSASAVPTEPEAVETKLARLSANLRPVWVQTRSSVEPVYDDSYSEADARPSVDGHGILHAVSSHAEPPDVDELPRIDWYQFDHEGNVIAVRQVDEVSLAPQVKWDREGNLIALQYADSRGTTTQHVDVRKISPDGQRIWARTIELESEDAANVYRMLALALDPDGNIYFTQNRNDRQDIMLYRIDADGAHCASAPIPESALGPVTWLAYFDGTLYHGMTGGRQTSLGRLQL